MVHLWNSLVQFSVFSDSKGKYRQRFCCHICYSRIKTEEDETLEEEEDSTIQSKYEHCCLHEVHTSMTDLYCKSEQLID